MDALGEALQATVSRWKCKFSAPLPLELYTSSNFIGLFVKEDSADILKKFAADFAAEAASKTGEIVPSYLGSRPVRVGRGSKRGRQRRDEGHACAAPGTLAISQLRIWGLCQDSLGIAKRGGIATN